MGKCYFSYFLCLLDRPRINLGGVLHEEFYAKSDALLEMLKQKRRERKALLKTDDPEIPC